MKGFNVETMDEVELCTYSDEALALVGFENYFEVWIEHGLVLGLESEVLF